MSISNTTTIVLSSLAILPQLRVNLSGIKVLSSQAVRHDNTYKMGLTVEIIDEKLFCLTKLKYCLIIL